MSALALLLCAGSACGAPFDRGHLKLGAQLLDLPGDSVLRDVGDPPLRDQSAALRLNFRSRHNAWHLAVDAQLLAARGDRRDLFRRLPDPAQVVPVFPRDDLRALDLSFGASGPGDTDFVTRLDRLHIDYRGERLVLSAGRQALSWGNGTFYRPMDIFNPFDPAALDTEYKAGDDMLYGQYLLSDGSDWQFALVQRRSGTGSAGGGARTAVARYHRFSSTLEFDLLAGEHYRQAVVGAAVSRPAGPALLRAETLLSRTGAGWVATAVANASWVAALGERPVTVDIEFYYNGFGLDVGNGNAFLSPENVELLDRLRRGELFTVGRRVAAASASVALTPLLSLAPTVFANLDDRSALLQLRASWDPAQDWQLLAAVSVPLGDRGSEYGGLPVPGADDRWLRTGAGAFLQLARYF